MCEEFAGINHFFASVTFTYDQFCDFNWYDFFSNVPDVKRCEKYFCVTNSFLLLTGVIDTFIFVTSVQIAFLLYRVFSTYWHRHFDIHVHLFKP